MKSFNKPPPMRKYIQNKIDENNAEIEVYQALADANPDDNGYYIYMISIFRKSIEDYEKTLDEMN